MDREEIKRLFWDQYQKDLDSTLPEDATERDKVQRIIRRYLYDRKLIWCSIKYGIWVDGWDAETRQPKTIVALYPVGRVALLQYRHNTEGIPGEYYNVPRENLYSISNKDNERFEEIYDVLTDNEVLPFLIEAIEPY